MSFQLAVALYWILNGLPEITWIVCLAALSSLARDLQWRRRFGQWMLNENDGGDPGVPWQGRAARKRKWWTEDDL